MLGIKAPTVANKGHACVPLVLHAVPCCLERYPMHENEINYRAQDAALNESRILPVIQ